MNWIITQGTADIAKNTIKYLPKKTTNELGQEVYISTIIGSDVNFENGDIGFTVKLGDNKSLCHVVFNYDTDLPIVIAGLNANGFLYGIVKLVSSKWENLNVTGSPETFDTNKEYNIKIKVLGSLIELYVNGIKVCAAFERIKKTQLRLMLQGSKAIEIKNFSVSEQKPKAFVIMQFSDEYNQLYEEVIRPVIEGFGIQCERADEYSSTNPIIQDIVNSITEASVVIADVTPDNPNVFYEVGYSHALGKPTILLCDKKRTKLPFDLSSFRTLFYDNTIAGKAQVEKRLKKFLDNIF